MAQKYDAIAPATSPNFDEDDVARGEGACEFPFRELVGALQWVATVARPDVARPVNILATYLSEPATPKRASAAMRVLRYLLGTKEKGLVYSPGGEERFQQEYKEVLDSAPREARCGDFPHLQLFSDASFATCRKTLNSVSGAILYFRSVPVMWRSKRQAIRTYSTMESEWVAASDAIKMVESAGCLNFLESGNSVGESSLPDAMWLWVDNKSAIIAATSEELKPKSKHFALRYVRVRDEHARLKFCPSSLQRADGLTKLVGAVARRQALGPLSNAQKQALRGQ